MKQNHLKEIFVIIIIVVIGFFFDLRSEKMFSIFFYRDCSNRGEK